MEDCRSRTVVEARRGRAYAFETIEPRRTAHLVVDMQNAFVDPGGIAEIPNARSIIDRINEISDAVRRAGGHVLYLQNTCDETAVSSWGNYFNYFWEPAQRELLFAALTPGSHGHDLSSALRVLPEDLVIRKTRFSPFIAGSSDLHERLRGLGVDTLIITGVLTNACCEATARDAVMMNYKVLFVSDGTATDDAQQHNASLKTLRRFCDVVTTERVLSLTGS